MPRYITISQIIALIFTLYSATAEASVPLIMELDMVGSELRFWWKEGHFMTGKENKYLQPLINKESSTPPKEPEWTELGKQCSKKNVLHEKIGKLPVTIKANSSTTETRIQMFRDAMLLAENVIAHPMDLCSMHLLQADNVVGPELIILWQLKAKANGVTIFRIPESLL